MAIGLYSVFVAQCFRVLALLIMTSVQGRGYFQHTNTIIQIQPSNKCCACVFVYLRNEGQVKLLRCRRVWPRQNKKVAEKINRVDKKKRKTGTKNRKWGSVCFFSRPGPIVPMEVHTAGNLRQSCSTYKDTHTSMHIWRGTQNKNGDMSFIQPILKYYTVKSFSLVFNKKITWIWINARTRTHTEYTKQYTVWAGICCVSYIYLQWALYKKKNTQHT